MNNQGNDHQKIIQEGKNTRRSSHPDPIVMIREKTENWQMLKKLSKDGLLWTLLKCKLPWWCKQECGCDSGRLEEVKGPHQIIRYTLQDWHKQVLAWGSGRLTAMSHHTLTSRGATDGDGFHLAVAPWVIRVVQRRLSGCAAFPAPQVASHQCHKGQARPHTQDDNLQHTASQSMPPLPCTNTTHIYSSPGHDKWFWQRIYVLHTCILEFIRSCLKKMKMNHS